MCVETINKTGNLKKKRRSRKDTRLREASERAVDKQVVETNSEQLAERLLKPKKKKEKTITETTNDKKCSNCGNTGHNKKT